MSSTSRPAPVSHSPSPGPSNGPANRHAPTALEAQRLQLERLLKDPSKPVHIPAGPKEKSIRPAKEMMKNVQGSSAGAGSGEFHVYKAARRREYERLKLMEEKAEKEKTTSEFEEKQRRMREEADAKTAKNRAKRQKKKDRAKEKGKGSEVTHNGSSTTMQNVSASAPTSGAPLKKRRLVNGTEMVFKKPIEEDEEESDEEAGPQPQLMSGTPIVESKDETTDTSGVVNTSESTKIIIHDDD